MLAAPDLELIEQPEVILQNYTLQDKISIPAAPEVTGQKMNHEKVGGGGGKKPPN